MSTITESSQSQDLNFIFKSLGKRGQKGEKWQQHTETVLFYGLRQVSELVEKHFGHHISFQPTGSAVEDLKNVELNDVGDVDIIIFPNSDDLMIHDEIIEYLPQNPQYVRIKGADHPLLQSCLVEGTEYVATSALKNFHPAIYGESAPHIRDLIIRAIQQISSQYFPSIVRSTSEIINKDESPAITLNFARNRCRSILELNGQTENGNAGPDIRTAEWEWMILSLYKAMGIPYTRELAKVTDDITQFMNDIGMACSSKGLNSPAEVVPFLREAYWSDRGEDLRERIVQTAIRDRNGDPKELEKSEHATGQNNEQWSSEEENGDATAQNCLQGPFLAEAHPKQSSPEDLESTLLQPAPRQPSGDGEQLLKRNLHGNLAKRQDVEQENEVTGNLSEEEQVSLTSKMKFTREALSRSRCRDGKEQERKRQLQTRKQNRFFDHLFGPIKDSARRTASQDTELSQFVGGFDFVPAFRAPGWPKVAREWITRRRKWPSPDMVGRVAHEGFHLVAKSPKNGGKADRDFRISFSHAEYLLSREMNDIQRECYRCLKKFHRSYLSQEPKGLVTFHLKNLLLQTIEETGTEMWKESNRAKCMAMLFDNLLEALNKKYLQHFFVRSYNIFGEDYIENPTILESLAGITMQIRDNPIQFAKPLMQYQVSGHTAAVEEKECSPNITEADTANPEHGTSEIPDFLSKRYALTQAERRELTCQGRSSTSDLRYHDMKDTFCSISKELTDMAFNEHTSDTALQALGPLERSLVDSLREIEKIGIVHVDQFPRMFDISWDVAYWRMLLSTEPNMRRRVLEGIQSVVEICRYVFKQDDFPPGNENAIIERMHDVYSENSFDLNRFVPAGSGTQLILKLFNGPQLSGEQPEKPTDFEIPLD